MNSFTYHRHITGDSSLGGCPGLVVMGGDSCAEGRVFESQHSILDGHFFPLICYKFEKTKINEKGVGDGPFFTRDSSSRFYKWRTVIK